MYLLAPLCSILFLFVQKAYLHDLQYVQYVTEEIFINRKALSMIIKSINSQMN